MCSTSRARLPRCSSPSLLSLSLPLSLSRAHSSIPTPVSCTNTHCVDQPLNTVPPSQALQAAVHVVPRASVHRRGPTRIRAAAAAAAAIRTATRRPTRPWRRRWIHGRLRRGPRRPCGRHGSRCCVCGRRRFARAAPARRSDSVGERAHAKELADQEQPGGRRAWRQRYVPASSRSSHRMHAPVCFSWFGGWIHARAHYLP
jgi:hypothetical protein